MKFAIYARQSKFKGIGESIENQVNACNKYIYYHHENISKDDIEIFSEQNVSGKNTKRPIFQKMLEKINKKQFDFVVCYQLDRISRRVNDFSNFIENLEKKGIKFVSVKEQFDTSTPIGKAMMNITAVFAQMERDTIAERVKDNMMFLAQSGRWLGGVLPRGFSAEKTKQIILDDKVSNVSYLKENNDIQIVKIIYQKFLETGCLRTVSQYIFSLGCTDKNNRPLNSTIIKSILCNPVYCVADKNSFEYFSSKGSTVCFGEKDFKKKLGIVPYNRTRNMHSINNDISKWIIAIGKHSGVIKSEDWIAVQNIMSKNVSRPRIHRSNGLLAGLIFCKNCNACMVVHTDYRRKDNKNFYYICATKESRGKQFCSSKNLNGLRTDEKIINQLMNFDEKTLRKKLHSRKFSQKINKMKDEAEELHFQIIELQEKKHKYLNHLLKTEPGSSFALEIKDTVNKITSKIKKCELQKADFQTKSKQAIEEKSDVDQLVKNVVYFKQHFHELEIIEKKSLLRLIIDKIVWDGDDLKIILNGE